MVSDKKPNKLLNSRAYIKARSLVSETIKSPKRLLQLVSKAQAKAAKNPSGKLSGLISSISAAFRLLKSYASGEYRDISLESLALIVASIIYFVMPIDVLPDFILSIGFADDAALLAWTFRSVADDLERYIAWENHHHQSDNAKITENEQD